MNGQKTSVTCVRLNFVWDGNPKQARRQALESGGAQFKAGGSNFEMMRPSVVIVSEANDERSKLLRPQRVVRAGGLGAL